MRDMTGAAADVRRWVSVSLLAREAAALVSWTYNLGGDSLRTSTMRRKLNDSDKSSVPSEMRRWHFQGSEPLLGLVRRRLAEAGIFVGLEPSQACDRAWTEINSLDDWPAFSDGIVPALSVGATVPSPTADVAADPLIERLNLRPIARQAAYELKRQHPQVVFTSGRRDKAGQARAMAENSAGRPSWISETYAPNKASVACQKWVLDNPQARAVDQIAAGLLGVMNTLSDTELGQMSRHLSGDAFDIQPVEPDHRNIKGTIRTLAGLRNFFDRDGGLIRWHAEFNA